MYQNGKFKKQQRGWCRLSEEWGDKLTKFVQILNGGKRTNKNHSILIDPNTLFKAYREVETPVNDWAVYIICSLT